MKRLLKKFPVNGSSVKIIENNSEKKPQNIEKIELKSVISQEIGEIKQELEQSKPVVLGDDIRLLGELLGYLRQNKEMSLLMLCRQIKTIKVDAGVAEIVSDDDNMKSLVSNEKYHQVVGEFFKGKGLGFKIFYKYRFEKVLG